MVPQGTDSSCWLIAKWEWDGYPRLAWHPHSLDSCPCGMICHFFSLVEFHGFVIYFKRSSLPLSLNVLLMRRGDVCFKSPNTHILTHFKEQTVSSPTKNKTMLPGHCWKPKMQKDQRQVSELFHLVLWLSTTFYCCWPCVPTQNKRFWRTTSLSLLAHTHHTYEK